MWVSVFSRASGDAGKCAQSKKRGGGGRVTMSTNQCPMSSALQEEFTVVGAALGRATPERLAVADGRSPHLAGLPQIFAAPRVSALLREGTRGRPHRRLDQPPGPERAPAGRRRCEWSGRSRRRPEGPTAG